MTAAATACGMEPVVSYAVAPCLLDAIIAEAIRPDRLAELLAIYGPPCLLRSALIETKLREYVDVRVEKCLICGKVGARVERCCRIDGKIAWIVVKARRHGVD